MIYIICLIWLYLSSPHIPLNERASWDLFFPPRAGLPPCEPHCGGHQPLHRHTGLVSTWESQRADPTLRGPVRERVLLGLDEHLLKRSDSDQREAVLILQRVCEGVH